jgi:hypothetical protein
MSEPISRTVWALRHRVSGQYLTADILAGAPVHTAFPELAVTRLLEASMPRLIDDAATAGIPVAEYEPVSFTLQASRSTPWRWTAPVAS